MARVAGKSGSATINSVTYNGVTSWEIDYKGAAIDTTGMDSAGVKEFVGGLTEWSGSLDLNWDVSQAPPAPASIFPAVFLTGGSGSYDSWAGNVLVTSVKSSVPLDGVCKLAIAFQGTGALSIS
jgi:predicted secreted protein